MIIKQRPEGRRESLESLFTRILTSTETPRVIRVDGAAERIKELEFLNQKRLTKIRRLREGIRSYQRCHERDQLALRAARSRIYELEGQVKSLRAFING